MCIEYIENNRGVISIYNIISIYTRSGGVISSPPPSHDNKTNTTFTTIRAPSISRLYRVL